MKKFNLSREEFEDEEDLIKFYSASVAVHFPGFSASNPSSERIILKSAKKQAVWVPFLKANEAVFWNPSLPHSGSTLLGNYEMISSKSKIPFKVRLGLYFRASLIGDVTEVDDSIWALNWLVEHALTALDTTWNRERSRYKPLEFEKRMPQFWEGLKKFPQLQQRIITEVSLMNSRRISSLHTQNQPADIVAKYVLKLLGV